MKKFKRIFVIVMDSFGAGHAKDGVTGSPKSGPDWDLQISIFKENTGLEHPLGYQLVLNEKSCGKRYDRTLGNDGNLSPQSHFALRIMVFRGTDP